MSGIPQFNFPAFYAAAKDLRARGYDIVSPAELDDQEIAAQAMSSRDGNPQNVHRTWGDFLARDVKIVADQVQGIIFLPDWHKSRGARLEAFVGCLCKDHAFMEYGAALTPISKAVVLAYIYLEESRVRHG